MSFYDGLHFIPIQSAHARCETWQREACNVLGQRELGNLTPDKVYQSRSSSQGKATAAKDKAA